MKLIANITNHFVNDLLFNIPQDKKQKAAELVEDYAQFMISENRPISFGKCDFLVIFIPLILILFKQYDETDYVKVTDDFKSWYDSEGVEWENSIDDMEPLYYTALYIEHYKKKYVNI